MVKTYFCALVRLFSNCGELASTEVLVHIGDGNWGAASRLR